MEKLANIKRQDYLINGVYKITNIVNNKIYVGSSSSKYCLYTRLKHHYGDLMKNKHANKYLQNSWNKYGEDKFYVEIIEICLPKDCITKEQYWLDILKPTYNFCKIAGSSVGTIPSEETRLKISKSNKEWYNTPEGILFKKKLSELKKNKSGHKHSEEFKKMISEKHKGRIITEETKNKLRYKRPYLNKKVININTKIIYTNAEEYSKLFNISLSYVRMLCRGEKSSKKHKIIYYE